MDRAAHASDQDRPARRQREAADLFGGDLRGAGRWDRVTTSTSAGT
jgi:hypothetical protein